MSNKLVSVTLRPLVADAVLYLLGGFGEFSGHRDAHLFEEALGERMQAIAVSVTTENEIEVSVSDDGEF